MKVITSAKRNTAMGYNKMHQKLFYYGRNTIVPRLVKLWNLILCVHATSPNNWKYADIAPQPKPGRNNSEKTDQLVSIS